MFLCISISVNYVRIPLEICGTDHRQWRPPPGPTNSIKNQFPLHAFSGHAIQSNPNDYIILNYYTFSVSRIEFSSVAIVLVGLRSRPLYMHIRTRYQYTYNISPLYVYWTIQQNCAPNDVHIRLFGGAQDVVCLAVLNHPRFMFAEECVPFLPFAQSFIFIAATSQYYQWCGSSSLMSLEHRELWIS